MHEIISMIIPNDNQVQLPLSIVNDSSIAHLSDPSPLKLPQISKKINLPYTLDSAQNIRFENTNHKVTTAGIQRFGILDQIEMINILKFLLTFGLPHNLPI